MMKRALSDFKICLTALVTPFSKDSQGELRVDEGSLKKLVQAQLAAGIKGFVINGTTAESPTLKPEEREQIFKWVKAWVPENTVLVMGTGTNSTASTIDQTKKAHTLGADAALVVVPYYNKPPQRGLVKHFELIADQSQIPIILYNVPGRTVARLELDSIKKLSAHPNIIGIKEATGDIDFLKQIKKSVSEDFILLSGDDGTYEEFLAAGGHGVISVASHVIPQPMIEGKIKKYLPLIDQLFCEANPIPVKRALRELGIIENADCRLPLVEMDVDLAKKMIQVIKEVGLQ